MLFFKLLRESYIFAIHEIIVNKTRTLLSLLGITIGIFCIISVFTVFDSLEQSIRNSINTLGNNTLFIQKWPWSMNETDYPWWKYLKRPETSLNELQEIQRRSQTADAAAFFVNTRRHVHYQNNTIENTTIVAVSHDYDKVLTFELADGRYFTPQESTSGKNVCLVGADIADQLFPQGDAIGHRIKVFGQKAEVIGVFARKGNDNFGNSNDENIVIPVRYARNFLDFRNMGTSIMVKAQSHISNNQMREELRGIMRSVRKQKPGAEDNFAINETSIITQGFDQLFGVISAVGWIIGGFSLLVGGFGIANIMFVSVKERTSQIGIQKSLGAKRYFILLQFLFEAVFLSLFGGIIGLLLVFLGSLIGSSTTGMELSLTNANMILGISVSIIIGLVSGIVPSFLASRLDPVEAIRTTF